MAAIRVLVFRTLSLSTHSFTKPVFKTLHNSTNNIIRHSGSYNARFSSTLAGNSTNKGTDVLQHMEKCSENNSNFYEKRNISVEKILSDFGVPIKKVQNQMDITRLSLERVKEKIKFLEGLGLRGEDVGKLLTRRPSVLVAKYEHLQARVEALKKVGIHPDSLVYAVKKSPGILTAKTENTIFPKVKYLLGVKVKPKLTKEEVLHILTKCPDIIATCSLDSIKNKIHFLENVLKFNQHQLRNIIVKQPTVLTFSTDSMKSKFAYCYNELNARRSSIARCPRIFQCSLKRIKERHQFLLSVGRLKEDMIIDDYGLGVIVTQTDKYFADKVALSTLEEYESFRMSMPVKE